MLLDIHVLQAVALVGAAAALPALGLCVPWSRRMTRLRMAGDLLVAGDTDAGLVCAVGTQANRMDALRLDVGQLRGELAAARAELPDALRHVAVVRYDAFGDMGGRTSFSHALLDDAGDGLVLTSINGRAEARTYAKGVTARGSEHSPLARREAGDRARCSRVHRLGRRSRTSPSWPAMRAAP